MVSKGWPKDIDGYADFLDRFTGNDWRNSKVWNDGVAAPSQLGHRGILVPWQCGHPNLKSVVEVGSGMHTFCVAIYALITGVALLQSFLVLLQCWEHRRFGRSRRRGLGIQPQSNSRRLQLNRRNRSVGEASAQPLGLCFPTDKGKVMVYAPCKGLDVDLKETLHYLLNQDYPNYEVTFIVDSVWDPAYRLIRRSMIDHPQVVTHLVVAGLAEDCGQKVHNLRMATADIPADVRYLAFLDSDAKPKRFWLRALISNLDVPGVGAATGYRWLAPTSARLASWIIYSINCHVTVAMRSRGRNLVWGGSWAMRRETFQRLQIREAWDGMLTEDLIVAAEVHRHKLRVEFEPACMVPSPLQGSSRQLFSFLRRQYLLGRYYASDVWRLGCTTLSLANVALGTNLGLLAWGLVAHPTMAWVAGTVCATLYALHAARGFVRQSLIRLYCPEWAESLRKASWFDIWAGPLVSAVSLAVVLSSMAGRTVVWRGITYQVLSDGRTRVLQRESSPQGEPCEQGQVMEKRRGKPTTEVIGQSEVDEPCSYCRAA